MKVEVIIPDELLRIGGRMDDAARLAFPLLTDGITRAGKQSINAKVKNGTGAYERDFGVIGLSESESVLDSVHGVADPNIIYGDIFERGRTDVNYTGRFPLLDVVENVVPQLVDDFVHDVFDERTFN